MSLSSEEDEMEEIDWNNSSMNLKTDDFGLVKFFTKKSVVYYVGGVMKCDSFDEVEVQFMHKKGGIWKFYYLNVVDNSVIEKQDILFKLPAPISSGGQRDNNTTSVVSLFVKNASVSNLWELDVLGIGDPTERKSSEETALAARKLFFETVSSDSSGRYEVRLPWLEGHPALPNNYQIAKRRLESTFKKITKDGYLEAYDQIFKDWLDEGIIEEISEEQPSQECHYLPHRPIIKPNSLSTKIRPVFDASAKEKHRPSLNQCLEKGVNLIELIPAILLRFRQKEIGVISDIRKAFLQIGLHKADRDFLRFLWIDKTGKERIYRHCRVVFGISSSPFLLAATLDYHLSQMLEKCSSALLNVSEDTITNLSNSFYVDNCVTTQQDTAAETTQEYSVETTYEEYEYESTFSLSELSKLEKFVLPPRTTILALSQSGGDKEEDKKYVVTNHGKADLFVEVVHLNNQDDAPQWCVVQPDQTTEIAIEDSLEQSVLKVSNNSYEEEVSFSAEGGHVIDDLENNIEELLDSDETEIEIVVLENFSLSPRTAVTVLSQNVEGSNEHPGKYTVTNLGVAAFDIELKRTSPVQTMDLHRKTVQPNTSESFELTAQFQNTVLEVINTSQTEDAVFRAEGGDVIEDLEDLVRNIDEKVKTVVSHTVTTLESFHLVSRSSVTALMYDPDDVTLSEHHNFTVTNNGQSEIEVEVMYTDSDDRENDQYRVVKPNETVVIEHKKDAGIALLNILNRNYTEVAVITATGGRVVRDIMRKVKQLVSDDKSIMLVNNFHLAPASSVVVMHQVGRFRRRPVYPAGHRKPQHVVVRRLQYHPGRKPGRLPCKPAVPRPCKPAGRPAGPGRRPFRRPACRPVIRPAQRPDQGAQHPAQGRPHPAQQGHHPAQQQHRPAQQQHHPAQQQHRPGQQQHHPALQQHHPGQQQLRPAQQHRPQVGQCRPARRPRIVMRPAVVRKTIVHDRYTVVNHGRRNHEVVRTQVVQPNETQVLLLEGVHDSSLKIVNESETDYANFSAEGGEVVHGFRYMVRPLRRRPGARRCFWGF
ncbi:unnamed protein product [Diabrotica balteata]|uniref:Uncharacterized protein n=1 Tax=Diabrotica balteata TaxID=107213 RepID=A0A9N9SP25_DIABA|nr:unnamed protein product [Diabrotica balteata]